MYRILILICGLTLLPSFAAPPAVAQEVFEQDPILERNREATVRVRAGRTVGTGTFFLKRNGNYYILTNAHVAGGRGSRVSFQMWWRGYLSKEINGVVVWSVLRRNYHRDVAIIEVPESAFQGYEPPVIPLAPPDYEPKFQRIYSFGCGAGSWLTNWEGHSIRFDNSAGEVINFVPQPAGGRSGSAIFSHDGKYIIGLIAWRSESGQHSLDGGSENQSQYGIAMTFREVRAALEGSQTTTVLNYEPIPLELDEYQEFKNAASIPGDAPVVFQENAENINNPNTHDAESVLDGVQLKFQDYRDSADRSPASGGIVQQNNGAEYTEIVQRDNQQIFPGVPPRQEPQREQPQPPAPEESFPFDDTPEPPRDRPRLIPPQRQPEEQPAPPELHPDPQSPEQSPEQEPEFDEDKGVNWWQVGWVAFVVIGVLSWFKRPANWVNLRLNLLFNRQRLKELVCDNEISE